MEAEESVISFCSEFGFKEFENTDLQFLENIQPIRWGTGLGTVAKTICGDRANHTSDNVLAHFIVIRPTKDIFFFKFDFVFDFMFDLMFDLIFDLIFIFDFISAFFFL